MIFVILPSSFTQIFIYIFWKETLAQHLANNATLNLTVQRKQILPDHICVRIKCYSFELLTGMKICIKPSLSQMLPGTDTYNLH